MLKVFLAEDESVVREGLRDNIPWAQYGFEFAGEAADGEIALTAIRKIMPDLLITDIRMPFMDGLTLCHIVHQEFPNMKMIIISGFDDFEYARRAIQEGVDQYLSKPVTRRAMQNALMEVKKKIDNEREQEDYVRQFQSEKQDYDLFYRRVFFEQIFSGSLSLEEVYRQAQKLSLDISGPCYNLILFSIAEKKNPDADGSVEAARFQEDLIHFFLRYSHYLFFRWSINTFCVLIRGDEERVRYLSDLGMETIKETLSGHESVLDWYAACSEPVERFSRLQECYNKVSHLFSYRFLMPEIHVLTDDVASSWQAENETGSLGHMDPGKMDPEIIRGFLKNGQKEEVGEFTESYLESISDAMKSRMFRDYVMLNVFFTCQSFVQEGGGSTDELQKTAERAHELSGSPEGVREYFESLLGASMDERDAQEGALGSRILQGALAYIDEKFSDPQLSLNAAAAQADVSANYFSALFSRKMQMTFVEYVTQKRMEKAKELLRTTGMHTAEIATATGYKDPHYFSFVFKKTTGKTPREYRSSGE